MAGAVMWSQTSMLDIGGVVYIARPTYWPAGECSLGEELEASGGGLGVAPSPPVQAGPGDVPRLADLLGEGSDDGGDPWSMMYVVGWVGRCWWRPG